jgi:glycosyltransferase involved in cell wall biosynthesis
LRAENPDLLLTYNWGSTEWALVNRFGPRLRHIHFESGFGPEEADRQLKRRTLFRRVALARAEKIVVPSHVLVSIVRDIWRLDERKLEFVPNGVDCVRYAAAPDPALAPGLAAVGGGPVIGTVALLRPEKNLARLVRAFARLSDTTARLLIVGDGSERPGLERLAGELGIAGRTVFTGYVSAPEKILGLIDVFAMSSDTEQMPNALLQAMANGRCVVATDVGDIRPIVAEENRPYVVARDDDDAYLAAMTALAADAALRTRLGDANRVRANDTYSFERMAADYERILLP